MSGFGDEVHSAPMAGAPDLDQVTGRYFANSKAKRSSERSYDEAIAARLWQVSAELVGMARRTERLDARVG